MDISTVRLLKSFDVEKLRQDLDAAVRHFAPAAQIGSYHDGSWKGITLRNSTGNQADTMAFSTSRSQDTPVMELCPYFRAILQEIGCPVGVARLLFLPPGKVIGEHVDSGLGFDAGLLRLHIPIVTDARVQFRIGDQDVHWQPGEFWYGDFALPHSLHNRSDIVRVHLVLDCEITPATLALFPAEFIAGVRVQKNIVETVGLALEQGELRQLDGYLKLTGRVLGLPLPILGRLQAESPHLRLQVPGIPLRYYLTVVERGILRSNLHQLTWQDLPADSDAVAVEYRNLKTGATLPFVFSRRLGLLTHGYLLLQAGLLGAGYSLILLVNRLRRLLQRSAARSLDS